MLSGKRIILILIASLLLSIILLPTVSYLQDGSNPIAKRAHKIDSELPLLEVGKASEIRPLSAAPGEIRVVSYNIRWRGGDELREMIKLFKEDAEIGNATVLGLQEVDRNKRRTANVNTVKQIAEELGMYYAWATPPRVRADSEEETGVAILSPYPLADIERIVLPHEGPGRRRRVAVGATVTVRGTPIRVYSVHSETRLQVAKKIDQFKAVLDDLMKYPSHKPAIVLGDLNTWERSAVRRTVELFSAANFRTPFENGDSTFQRKVLLVGINLKLDWIWLRGFEASKYGIERNIYLSDHWPLWTVVRLSAEEERPAPSQEIKSR